MSDSDDNANALLDGQMENGHIPLDENNAEETPEGSDQFDLDLPTSHRYLGKLDNVSGYTYYEDGEEVTLAAVKTNTLVFPGFTLPLVLNNDHEVNLLQRHTTRKKCFILLTPGKNFFDVFPFGMIMEIYEYNLRNEVVHLKARGRQRCRLVPRTQIKTLVGELYQATVNVLAEPPVTSPICDTQLKALAQRRPLIGDIMRYRRYHYCQFPHAGWIYDKHEISFLVDKLREGLSTYYLVEFIPKDAVRLSYWFVQNYQLRHEERLKVMTLGGAVERLRMELRFLAKTRVICCARCQAEIAQHDSIFPMSKDGVQSNYCNPNGHVFETVTVSSATNYSKVGRPSAQFSWFPGYSWTIIECKRCKSHLGWQFKSHSLLPHKFFGLAKSGFDVKIIEEGEEGGERDERA